MDVWKIMIRDDASKFQQETAEKKIQKVTNQADYRSYLDKQMDHFKQLQV